MRIFPKSRWKKWRKRKKKLVEAERKSPRNPLAAEVVSLMRNSRTKEQKWRARVQEWMANLEAEKQEQQIKYEKKRRRHREQLKEPNCLEVEVLSNKPTAEEFEWKEFKIQVRPDYHLNEIIQEVRKRWVIIWADEFLETVNLWGKEGRLDQEERRTWVDGERFIVPTQPREGRPDIEGESRLGQEKAPVNEFSEQQIGEERYRGDGRRTIQVGRKNGREITKIKSQVEARRTP
jgi:hypothetical protein